MDKRITDALATIGSIVDTDCDVDACNEIITQLVDMKEFAYCIKWGKKFRLEGKIELANNMEKQAADLYEKFPTEMKW